MAALTASYDQAVRYAGPGFGSLLRSEWTKLRSVRSTWIMFGLAIGLSIAFAIAIAITTGLTYDRMSDGLRNEFDPILTTLGGWLFGMMFVIAIGVTAVTSEYSSGMIRTTLIVSPNRTRVFLAKAIVTGLFGMLITAIVVPGMFIVSQPIFSHYGLETASITDHDVIRYFLIAGLLQGLYHTLVSFSIAWLIRGTAGAITAAIGFSVLPWMVTPIMPTWVKANVLRYLPDNAKDSLIGQLEPGATLYVHDGPAFLIVAIWTIGLVTAAAIALNRRDV